MTSDAIKEVRLLAPVVVSTSELGRSRQRDKLAEAIAAESALSQPERGSARATAGVPRRARHSSRRRAYLAGVAAAVLVAAGTAVPLLLGSRVPPAKRAVSPLTKGVTKHSMPVVELASYRLRLPRGYSLTAATGSNCSPPGVGFSAPSSSPAGGESWVMKPPPYESQMAVAANAQGGCISMVLAPPYTATAADPDPEAGTLESTQPVQVGRYEARAGTWTSVSKPSGVRTEQWSLYIEIPLADGQTQDLVVSSYGLSQNALVTIVANGLTVGAGSGPTAESSTGNAAA